MFKNFGGRKSFELSLSNVLKIIRVVKELLLATEGKGKVLVVDGGGSLRCALLGDMIGESAVKYGWEGVIIYGCVRDERFGTIRFGGASLSCDAFKKCA